MKPRLSHLRALLLEIEQRPVSTRALLLVAGGVILCLLWYLALWAPVSADKAGTQIEQKAQEKQLLLLSQEIQKLSLGESLDTGFYEKKRQLKDQLARLDTQFKNQSDQLVSADKMDDVLRTLLANFSSLRLMSLSSLPPQPLAVARFMGIKSSIYQYGIVMRFQGSYFATLQFLQQLAELPTHMLWESLTYQVALYPDADVTLQVYTLGRQESAS